MALLAWYKLDGNALDSSGNGLNLTTNTATSTTAGKIGGCYTFASGNAISTTSGINLPHNVSFTAWAYNNNAFAGSMMIFSCNSTLYSGPDLYFTGTISWNTGDGAGNPFKKDGVNVVYPSSNAWHHYAVVNNQELNKTFLYIDGEYYGEATYRNTFQENRGFTIGNYKPGSTGYAWRGMIDDVRIYNHLLSDKEIKELAKAKILHYTFDEFQEPTENIFPRSPFSLAFTSAYNGSNYGFGSGADLQQVLTPSLQLSSEASVTKVSRITGGTGQRDYVSINLSSPLNSTRVISFWYYGTFGTYIQPYNNDGCASLYYLDDNNTWQGGGTSVGVPVPVNQWKKITIKMVNRGTTTGTGWSWFIMHSNQTSATLTTAEYWAFTMFQMEEKYHATPFVNGTRTGRVVDKSGYDNHADLALATTPQWVEDSRIGKGAYRFDGNYIVTNFGNGLSMAEPHTFSMWVKSNSTSESIMFFGPSNGTSQRLYFAIYKGKWDIGIGNWAWGAGVTTATTDWTLFTVVLDGSIATLYINGEFSFSKSYTAYSLARDVWVGDAYSSYPFNGSLDDVRIYATALSADDIKELYNTRAQLDDKGNLFLNNLNQTKHKPLIMDYTTWQDGQTGSVDSFPQYSSRNFRVMGIDPWGKETVVWQGESTDGSTAGSGYYSNTIPIDNTKLYRMSWWMKRITNASATKGSFYVGLNGYGSTNGVWPLTSETHNTNPYFYSSSSITVLPDNEWILIVAHVWPYTYTGGVMHPESGRYRPDGTRIGNISRNYRWAPETTTGRSRTLMIYQPDAGGVIRQSVYPRIDICDGTEPSIAELTSGFDSRYIDYIRSKGGTANINLNIGEQTSYAGEISELGITNGLVAYYPLNGNAKDYTANNNDGTVNGATVASGINGKLCYEFDGISNQINLGNNNNITNSFSISTWVKANQITNSSIVAKGVSSSWFTNNYIMAVYGGKLRFKGTFSNSNELDSAISLSANTWYHLVGTYDNPSQKAFIYIDGVKDVKENLNCKTPTTVNTDCSIGGFTSYFFNGKIQNVRIYNRALSAEEITILYDLEKPNPTQMKLDSNTVYISGEFDERL